MLATPRSAALVLCALLVPAAALAGCAAPPPPAPPAPSGGGTAGGNMTGDGMAGGNMSMPGGGMAGPTYAPLPETTRGPAIPEKGYLVQEIRDGLYWVTEGTYQVIFLTTGQGVIVVDAPPSMGDRVLRAIREVTTEPVTHVVYSHSHADHIAGAGMYPPNATYVAHAATAAQLQRQQDPGRAAPFGTFVGGAPVPMPTLTFTGNRTLTQGNQTLELAYLGPAHEPGNLFIYAPKQRVLMLVDVIFPGWVPFAELAVSEDVPAFIAAHDQALAYDFDTFVGGHLTRLGTRQDVVTQREFIRDLQANAAKALQTVDFNAVAMKVGFENLWALFGTYLDQVAEECNRLMLEKWRGRLGGADVFTEGHCAVMVESLRID